MSDELDAIKAELSEWRDLAQERLNHIRFLESQVKAFEAHKPISPADPSDTAMLDWVLKECLVVTLWKTGRDAFQSREENKSLRTREDVRRQMEGL
jgi:hypothetical protein